MDRRQVLTTLGWIGVGIGYLIVKAGERWFRNRRTVSDTRAKLIAGSGDLADRVARMRRGEFMTTEAETTHDGN